MVIFAHQGSEMNDLLKVWPSSFLFLPGLVTSTKVLPSVVK